MDALHRRQVWSAIQQMRKGRLVVLTTHSMEEADVLGDTVAIMANGKVKAAGTPLFLKNRYGRGFQLRIITQPEDSIETETLVAQQLGNTEILATSAGNVAVSLGRHLGPRVPRFLRELEQGKLSELVTEWEISNTTLEQVFLRVCEQNQDLNQGAVEDDVYSAPTDPTQFSSLDIADVLNQSPWDKSPDAGVPFPAFSAEGAIVEVSWSDATKAVLGTVKTQNPMGQYDLKYVGTPRCPLEAAPIGDGRGTLSITLPPTGLPGQKLSVRIPDLRVITIVVPLHGTPGETHTFTASLPAQCSTSALDNSDGGAQSQDHGIETQITCRRQTSAMMKKSWRAQAKYRKTNCCQCCMLIFFSIFMFGLAPKKTLNPPPPSFALVDSDTNITSSDMGDALMDFTHPFSVYEAAVSSSAGLMISTVESNLTAGDADGDLKKEPVNNEAKAIGGSVLLMSLITTFNLPKLVHNVVEEKQARLYHSMRLQSLQLYSYWFSFWLWSLLLQAIIVVPMIFFGYVFGVAVYKHLDIWTYVAVLGAWAHSQAGVAAFAGSLFRSPKLAVIVFYLVIICSAFAVTIINQLTFLKEWPIPLLLFPVFAYERSLTLMLMGTDAASGELVKAVMINLISGSVLFVAGIVLHLVLPNEFGLSESQVLVEMCCRHRAKTDRGGDSSSELPGVGGSINARSALEEPLTLSLDASVEANSGGGDNAAEAAAAAAAAGGSGVGIMADVEEERQRVLSSNPVDSAVMFKGLGLRYSKGLTYESLRCAKKLLSIGDTRDSNGGRGDAVSDLCLGISKGEFFGLLGPNGAGKTSIINMLTGLVLQSRGQVTVGGHDTIGAMDKVHTLLGVCPQFDTVYANLTVEEHLQLFAGLKGIAPALLSGAVQGVAAAVNLDGDAFRQPASQLSGGMKRRLSMAIALIADPQIIVADGERLWPLFASLPSLSLSLARSLCVCVCVCVCVFV